jgi:(E)-4-hydroxy-3-methylbut-2-enyl-diphosphate synthase
LEKDKLRRKSRQIFVGDIPIGGDAPVAVQSMTNTDTRDISSTVNQIRRLYEAGCEIIRLAVPDVESAEAFREIKAKVDPPLIADIHFDYRLAIAAIKAGADGLRINPGNIGSREKITKVIQEAREREIPIRIGINTGSLPKKILERYGHPTPEAMMDSALEYIRLFEDLDFNNIKISLKSSNVLNTISAYRLLSQKVDYPFHLGVTEAGTLISGTVKNAIGIGILLFEGIGDTIRVSLSRDPIDEVKAAFEILRALDLRHRGPEIISCPTCGRCEIDLIRIVETVEKEIQGIRSSPKVAIMGCVVNGPGEAKEADVGVAGGRGQGILFKKGEIIKKIPEEDLAEVLIREVKKLVSG